LDWRQFERRVRADLYLWPPFLYPELPVHILEEIAAAIRGRKAAAAGAVGCAVEAACCGLCDH